MKKFLSFFLTSGFFAFNTIHLRADTVYVFSSPSSTPANIFSVSDNDGTITWTDLTDIPGSHVGSQYNFFDPATNKIYSQNWSTDQYSIYDIDYLIHLIDIMSQ